MKTAHGLDGLPLMPWETAERDSDEPTQDEVEGLLAFVDPEDEDTPDSEPEGDDSDELEEPDTADEDEPEEEEGEDDLDPEEEPDGEEDDLDEDDLDGEDEEPGDGPVYEIDGEQVTLEELRKGYLRQADYTRKQQERARREQEAEARAAEAQAARTQYLQGLQMIGAALEGQAGEEPDWDRLEKEDPQKFAVEFAVHQRRQADMQKVRAEQARVAQEWQAERQRLMEQHLEEERKALLKALPEWQDPEAANESKKQLAQYLERTYGFTEDDLGRVVDHRLMVLADKARRYDELNSDGRKKVQRKARKAGKTLKPGAGKSGPQGSQKALSKTQKRKLRERRQRLARSGRVEDAAALIEGMMDD